MKKNLKGVYKMSTISNLEYQPSSSYICTLTTNCILWKPDSIITSYNPGFQPSIITTENQFTLTKDTLEHISTLLKEKAEVSSVVLQDTKQQLIVISDDSPEKKQTSKQWVKCRSIVLYQNEKNVLLNGKWLPVIFMLMQLNSC